MGQVPLTGAWPMVRKVAPLKRRQSVAFVCLRKDRFDEEDNLTCRFCDDACGPGSLWGVLDYNISPDELRRHDEWRYFQHEYHQRPERQHDHFYHYAGRRGA